MRKIAFHGVLVLGMIFFGLLFLPMLATKESARRAIRFYGRFVFMCLHGIGKVNITILHQERLSTTTARIIACKHESAFDAYLLPVLFPGVIVVVKRELFSIPIFGWYLKRSGAIALVREEGMASVRTLHKQISRIKQEEPDARFAIFPEGTRVPYGQKGQYKKGVHLIYQAVQGSALPIALNSGRVWDKNGLQMTDATITVSIEPEIPHGLKAAPFMEALETAIETGCKQLQATCV